MLRKKLAPSFLACWAEPGRPGFWTGGPGLVEGRGEPLNLNHSTPRPHLYLLRSRTLLELPPPLLPPPSPAMDAEDDDLLGSLMTRLAGE